MITSNIGYSISSNKIMDAGTVSVIVPMFNVADYVGICIDSIINQTYDNLEILLVDDGSPDNCGKVAEEYARQDSRITVLQKANGGLSDARNYGLSHCHGEWVSFIDSDDYVSPIFIECMLRAALSCNCSISSVPGGKHFRDGEKCRLTESIDSIKPAIVYTDWEFQRLLLYQSVDTGAPWRLYRRSLLGNAPFPVGIYYEDLATTYRFVHEAKRIALLDSYDLYAYRLRPDSIIRQQFTPIKAKSALMVSEQLQAELTCWYPDLSAAVASRCFSVCRMVFAQLPSKSESSKEVDIEREALWEVLQSHRETVLHDERARKRERLAAAIAHLGIGPFSMFCSACRSIGVMR